MSTLLGQTVPLRIVRVSNTTLFDVAAQYLGDWQQWKRIQDLNGLSDIWIVKITELKIPGKARSRTSS
jgi:hypothetical protein